MPVTQHLLHTSAHAELLHKALALARDDQTLAWVRDAGMRQPLFDYPGHAPPAQVLGLVAAAQRAMPRPGDLFSEDLHPRPVAGHGEMAAVPADYRAQVLALLSNRSVQAPLEFILGCGQFGSQPLGTAQPQDHALALAGLLTSMGEANEVEGRRCALISAVTSFACRQAFNV